jgi:PleD family two-component response regulator
MLLLCWKAYMRCFSHVTEWIYSFVSLLIESQVLKKKALIVENDQDIRLIIDSILEEQGFPTLSMPEPNDLSAILFFAPDVILLDGFINRKMGQRLCRKINWF